MLRQLVEQVRRLRRLTGKNAQKSPNIRGKSAIAAEIRRKYTAFSMACADKNHFSVPS
jgi:hypothetical protein